VDPTCRREGERGEGRRWRSGPAWAKTLDGPAGWVGLVRLDLFFSFFFFSFFFQILFKPNSKFKSFSSFQFEILTQIYSNILRLLENFFKHFLIQTFNLFSFFLIQTFIPIFTIFFKDFSQIFF
jgi:hypothetical protein